jgi:hypothetical protein
MQISIFNIAHKQNKREQNFITTAIDVEKAFDKIQYPFMIKAIKKRGVDGLYLNIV